jgi:hypothetical protein
MKSKDISKYDIDWQILRVQLKQIKDPKEKLAHAFRFYQENPTSDTWERIVNWIDGLALGYKIKNRKIYTFIQTEKERFLRECPRPLVREKKTKLSFEQYPKSLLNQVYKDLFKRAKTWAENGYFNTELVEFLQRLENVLGCEIQKDFLKDSAQSSSISGKTHRFLY